MFDCVLPDPHRPNRQRAHVGGPPQPAERPLRPRPGAARRGLRLPRLHDVLARIHPAPREPGGAARPPAADPPQSTLRPGADPARARGDRAGGFRRVQARRARAARAEAQPHGSTDRHRHHRRPRLAPPRGAVAPAPALARGDAGRRQPSATRSSPPAACTPSSARPASASSGSRSPPASSSRSTGARSPRWHKKFLLHTRSRHETTPQANLFLLGLAPLASDASRPRARGARRRRAARRARLARAPAAPAGPRPPGRHARSSSRRSRRRARQLTSQMMDNAVSIMRTRVDKLGVSEPLITKQGTTRS